MASIRQKKGTRYWFACFTDNTGKQRQKITKETDRLKAKSTADELESFYLRAVGVYATHLRQTRVMAKAQPFA